MRIVRSTWITGLLASLGADACRIGLQGGSREAGYHAHEPDPNGRLRWPREPSQSVAMRLYAKALAIEDRKGGRLVLVTTDLMGLPEACQTSSERASKRNTDSSVAGYPELVSHPRRTHRGSEGRLASELRDEQKRVVMEYRNALVEQLVTVAGAALKI